ncbi:hypothetical protein HYW21_08090 [Candidatus Woesearchaeota archaeon]|nr:hypothetical protein [Candidatus Woesearchaeota archaeon]
MSKKSTTKTTETVKMSGQKSDKKTSSYFPNRFFQLVTLFVVLFIPLLPKIPLIRVTNSPTPVRLEDFLLVLIVIWWLFTCFTYKPLRMHLAKTVKGKIAVLVSLYLGFMLLTTVYNANQETISWLFGILFFLRQVEYVLIFFIVRSVVRDRDDLLFFARLLVIAVMLVSVLAILQQLGALDWMFQYTQRNDYTQSDYYKHELSSTFDGNYDLGLYLVISLAILLNIIFDRKKYDIGIPQKLIIVVFFLGLYVLIAAQAFMPYVSMAIVLLLFGIFRQHKLLVLGFVLLLVILPIFYVFYQREEQKGEASFFYEQKIRLSETLRQRFEVNWPKAYHAFQKNVFIGSGLSSVGFGIDGNYVRVLGEGGIIGLLLFLLFLISLATTHAMASFHHQDPLLKSLFFGFFLATIAVMVNALFTDAFISSKIAYTFWYLAALGTFFFRGRNEHALS